jgi:hypothetical protein
LAAVGLATDEAVVAEEGSDEGGGELVLLWDKSSNWPLLSCLVGDSGVTDRGGRTLGRFVERVETAGEFRIGFCFL